MVPLSERTTFVLEKLFPEQDQEMAIWLLSHECADNLPFHQDSGPEDLDRVRLAALKRSAGDLDRLLEAIELGKTDTRDLLMVAGFGSSVTEHVVWAKRLLTS
jgi:hypothetical protein